MEKTDWRISSLLHDSVTQYEQHAKRVEAILDVARLKFDKDHTGTTGAVGILLIAASIALAVFGKGALISAAGVAGGTLLMIAALILRHRAGESQLKHARTMVELERERAGFAQRSAVLQHIWLYGLPEGTPLAQIQLLLGDTSPSPVDDSGAPLRWRALPAEAEATNLPAAVSDGETSASAGV
jgi:hypothetical protein